MNNSQQQQQTIQQSNANAQDIKSNSFKHPMQDFDAAATSKQGLGDLNIPKFDDQTQNLNQLLNQVPSMAGLDKLPGGNPLLASNLQGITGQFNAGNFQAGLGNLDLSTLGSITGNLNLGMPNLPNGLLTDLPGLEGLAQGQNGQQLNALANLNGLPGHNQSIQSLQDNLLKNIQQNPVNFPFNPEKLDEKDKLVSSTAELLKQEIPQSAADLNNLGSALNQNPIDAFNQLSSKANATSGKNTPGQPTQNLQVNSGTTATTPGDNGSSANPQHQDKRDFDVKKILQDIQGFSDFNGGANSNNLQDVLKSLHGGQTTEQITKTQGQDSSAGNEREDAVKGLNLNPLTNINDYDQLQSLLGNVKKLDEPEKANQLGVNFKSPVDQNRSQDQLGQLNFGEYQLNNPQLQALHGLTNNLTPDSSQFGGLNANLPWSNPGLQTNNILQQLNNLNNPLANNASAIPNLANINGLGFGLNMNLNQFGNNASLPGASMPQMRQNSGSVLIPGSQAHVYNFNLKGPDNEIKLFVGGLAYQTQEYDLIDYFKKYGTVVDAIVMRDRQTQRGRGFGFVKMRFENKDSAQDNKWQLLSANFKNPTDGHKINGKLVDVKSADDYVKPGPGQPQQNTNVTTQLLAMSKEQNANQNRNQAEQGKPNFGAMQPRDGGKFNRDDQSNYLNVTKPNPYVIVKQKDSNGAAPGKDGDQKDQDENKQIVFEYPKSKIFVGGLDFKLTNDDLKQHFQQYGQIESAVILKDINTGQSRGFGFVTFKDEAVAQDLIQNVQNTNICGRKVDIKSAEPKQNSSNQPAPIIPRKMHNGGMYGGGGQNMNGGGNDRHSNQYAMIPQYGGGGGGDQHNNDQGSASGMRRGANDESGQDGYNDSQSSNNYPQRRGGDSMHRRGGNDYYQGRNGDGYGYQPNSQSYSNGPDYDGMRQERERGRDNYRDRRDKRYRDDRDRMDRGPRDRDRRNMGPEYDEERRERRIDRDRGRRRGHYQYSRSDSMDSSKSSSSYNNHHARRSREDRRGCNQQRDRRGSHHGGGNHGSPGRNEKETQ